MGLLVTGAESSGTKLVAWILTQTGAPVTHRSVPYGNVWMISPHAWDAIIVCHRHGPVTARSQTMAGHVDTPKDARSHMTSAYRIIYGYAHFCACPVHTVTYEAVIHEQRPALELLLADLSLTLDEEAWRLVTVELGDANAKHYGGRVFSDQRSVCERDSATS